MTAIARVKQPTDEERLERIKRVFPDDQEAQSILEWDKAIDQAKGKQLIEDEVGLTPEQEAIARKYTRTGTRKTPMIPNLTKRERKPNATKEGIIADLAEILEKESSFELKGLQIPNKSQKISFKIGEMWYTITLTEHQRTKPKWIEGD